LKKINTILIFLTLSSCNFDNKNSNQEPLSKANLNYVEKEFTSVYESQNKILFDEWINYNELNEYIIQINSNDYSSIINNKKYLVRFFKGLKNTIPDIINKFEVESRLTVIETDFLKFESILSNYSIDDNTKQSMVKKINNSFSNLNFQIDKIIEKQEVNP
tara:strand:- start:1492 stop:1974 length:483 start_codon:yes stop_codon:yes gene_type:complete